MPFNFRRGGRASSSAQGYLRLPYVGSRLPGEGEMSMFNTNLTSPTAGNRTVSHLGLGGGGNYGAGGRYSYQGDYGAVLDARRKAKLAAADPGLSTRGRYRTSAATMGSGLETRGARPSPGTRSVGAGGAVYGPGRRELGQVQARAVNRPRRMQAISNAKAVADSRRASAVNAARASAGHSAAGTSAAASAVSGANAAGSALTQQGARRGARFMETFSRMNMKSKIGIGLGLGVAAGVAMNRRGQGASSGRQSMYRY
jgi:hypothetical protein